MPAGAGSAIGALDGTGAVTVERFDGCASGYEVTFRRQSGLGLLRRMPEDVQFDRLALEVQRQGGTDGEFFRALQRSIHQTLYEHCVVEEHLR